MNKLIRVAMSMTLMLGSVAAIAADEYSVAEQRVFLDNHLKSFTRPATLQYEYKQTGKPEDSFEDKVKLTIADADASKRKVSVDYLSGTNKVELPEVDAPTANPVILYFLEKDIRDMNRLLGGQQAYFRKRIRLALADSAEVRPVKVTYKGKAVSASLVKIEPYINDPLKDRLGQYVGKTYLFTLSDEIPGGVYELRTMLAAPTGKSSNGVVPLSDTVLKISENAG